MDPNGLFDLIEILNQELLGDAASLNKNLPFEKLLSIIILK